MPKRQGLLAKWHDCRDCDLWEPGPISVLRTVERDVYHRGGVCRQRNYGYPYRPIIEIGCEAFTPCSAHDKAERLKCFRT